jgi:hypothetical protein
MIGRVLAGALGVGSLSAIVVVLGWLLTAQTVANPPLASSHPTRARPPQSRPSSRQSLLRELGFARDRWRQWQPTAYTLTVTQLCFCKGMSPVTSRVRSGAIESTAGGIDSDGEEVLPRLGTVEMLFSHVETLARGRDDEVRVTFDPRFGYPTSIDVDRFRGVFDDEMTWRAALTANP